MNYKKIVIITVIVLLAVAVYAQVEIEEFLNLKGVKILLDRSSVEKVEQEDNKLSLTINGNVIQIERSQEKYVDVTHENCDKLGFVYMPGHVMISLMRHNFMKKGGH